MEIALALLLLMLGGLHGETVGERKKEAFTRMMSKFDETHEKISENGNKTEILESKTQILEGKTQNLESKAENLEEEVDDLSGLLLGYLHYCPDLQNNIDGVPANIEPEDEKRTEGSVVNIPCAEGYYQCGNDASATCASDRTWTVSGASNCVEKTFTILQPENKVTYALPCVLPADSVVTVKGVPTSNDGFVVNFYDASGAIILHHSARFSYGWDYRVIVINTEANGRWGSEERVYDFPFQVNQDFKLVFKVTESTFKVFADDQTPYSFGRSGTKATQISVSGLAYYHSVEVIYP